VLALLLINIGNPSGRTGLLGAPSSSGYPIKYLLFAPLTKLGEVLVVVVVTTFGGSTGFSGGLGNLEF
jgi:hypothetical protein